MHRPTVALTGAGGFLGRHLTAALLSSGWRVRALSRSGSLDGIETEIVRGDLEDTTALSRLVEGVDAVIHAAAAIKANDAAAFHAINAGGTERLLGSMLASAPNAHAIIVSSLAAREPRLSPYAASKRAAEGHARRLVTQDRLTIVRPPTLYGPHDHQTLAVFRSAGYPLTPLLADGGERIALMDVRDASAAIVELLASRIAGTFSLADDRPGGYGMREIFVEAGRAQGKTPRFIRIPRRIFEGVGYGALAFARISRRPVILSPGKVAEMLHENWSVSPEEMPPGLQGRPRSIETGFAETVAWYRKAGWL